MINMEVPTIKKSLKGQKHLSQEDFVVTNEYEWTEHTNDNNTQACEPIQTNVYYVSVQCSCNVSISLYSSIRLEMRSKTKVIDLTCPVCGTSVIQSRCQGMKLKRRR